MPEYEFFCEKCNKSFTEIMSISEFEKKKGRVRCPKCKSKRVRQIISGVRVITSKKS